MAEEALARKKKIRAAHRSSATRLMGQAGALIEATPINADELALMETNLSGKLTTLEAANAEIVELTPEPQLEEEIGRADEYSENLQRSLLQIRKALKTLSPSTTPPRDPPSTTPPRDSPPRDPPTLHPDVSAAGGGAVGSSKVKLPKITLPHFKGNPIYWTAFWDSYESAVHLNSGLSNVDKFNYLRSLLERSAYEAIAGLTLSSANYGEAIEILKKRFGNRQMIISRHMEILLSLSAVSGEHDLRGLRRLYNEVEANVRSLKALGVERDSYGTMLTSVLLTKLPPEIRLLITRKASGEDLTLETLQAVFEEELVARECSRDPARNNRYPQDKPRPPTATTLLSGTRESNRESMACCYCQQSHASVDCHVVTNLDARRQILKTSGRCFNCLVRGHIGRRCRSPPQCQTCKRKHHPSICDRTVVTDLKSPPSAAESTNVSISTLNPEAPPYVSNPTSALCSASTKSVLLQTARALSYNPRKPDSRVELRILLDGGSQRSYLTERARRVLKLAPEGEQRLSIAAFGSARGGPKVCPIVNVGMLLKGYPSMTVSLFVVPMICEPLIGQPIDVCISQNPHLADLELADWADQGSRLEVDVLIGSDHYWDLVTGAVSKSTGGPTAIHTKLGWVLSGPIAVGGSNQCSTNLITTHVLRVDTQPDPLNDQLRAFWELESLGIQPNEKSMYDDSRSTIKLREGRYEVSLPWKQFHQPLPDNYSLSQQRLHGLLKRLRQNPALLRDYDCIIQEQIEKGIVEDAPAIEANSTQLHYLPHHAIVRSDKDTTKLRVVYDASAKRDGKPSLNDCLLVGPKFNQRIMDILMRFRSYRIPLTADIEKAFLMVSVEEKDRDVLRFLWVNDINEDEVKIRPLRFTRVVFGVCSSPFLLNSTIRHHLEQYRSSHPELIEKLINSFYVDDVVTGASTEEEAFQLYTDSKKILKDGAFNLRKFRTNSLSLQLKINAAEDQAENLQDAQSPSLEETYTDATLGKPHSTESPTVKVLGVIWNPQDDCLQFCVTDIAEAAATTEPTKRNVVSIIGKFYDPLGFLAPVIIRFKGLFQRLCERQLQWDEALPDALQREWEALVKDLHDSCSVSIPRSYYEGIDEDVCSYTLGGFCDASTTAYAAVVYLVMKTQRKSRTQFLVAKTRVAPMKALTIPRLELLSALLLARLITTVSSVLESTLPDLQKKCYTDSTVALHWIKGTSKEWKPFVQNRVNEIREKTSPVLWHHCPGATNPADLPSRGMTMSELRLSRLWRYGPDWLKDSLTANDADELAEMPKECSKELRASNKKSHNLVATEVKHTIGDVIQCERFSSFRRLVRVTAYAMRAVKLFQGKRTSQSSSSIAIQELSEAERRWIEDSQGSLEREKSFDSLKPQLNLFRDENGLWRCGGRLANADIPYSTKYPLLLSRNHPLTPLIINDAHRRVLHNGVRETLTEIRRRFWIVKGRSLVRAIIHRCVTCRRYEGAPFPTPPPPPLPVSRVTEAPAFSFTGVDFAGPLTIRTEGPNKTGKAWICLFTCFVTRAVHLDIVLDMSTPTFIRCLKRFAARRGLPRRFISDNGKTFKAASKFLKSVFKDDTVRDHLAEKGCEWTFNVERAPWWGGAFERMVQSTKRCLRKMVGQASLTHDELITAVTEIESIINSRPLSYVSAGDTEEPLTPSHLLIGRRVLNLPDHLGHLCDPGDEDFDIDSTQLTRRTKHLSNTLNHFWKRWRSEYLAELRESHRHLLKKSRGKPQVSVGDVVIVHEEGLARGFWKLGRIQSLMIGQDGKTRGATIRLAAKNRSTSLNRPLRLLYPLEIDSSSESMDAPQKARESEKQDENAERPICRPRPRRAAAQKSEEKRRLWMKDLTEDDIV